MTALQRLWRVIVCTVAWCMPVAMPVLAVGLYRLLGPEPEHREVNMFGQTGPESTATNIGLLIGIILVVAIPLLLRQGFLWLPVALLTSVLAIGLVVLANYLELPPGILVPIMLLPPVVGALVTKPRPRRQRA